MAFGTVGRSAILFDYTAGGWGAVTFPHCGGRGAWKEGRRWSNLSQPTIENKGYLT